MGYRIFISLVLLPSLMYDVTCGPTAENVTRLHQLVGAIDPRVAPISDQSRPIDVQVAANLLSIRQLDTASQTLTIVAWFVISWKNDYLTWDPQDYGGATHFYPDPEKTWRPPIVVRNTRNQIAPLGQFVQITAYANGLTIWYPGDVISVTCRVDVTHFPFDSHNCIVFLIVWSEVGTVLLAPMQETVNLLSYTENSEWTLKDTKLKASPLSYAENLTDVSLLIELQLERRASTLVVTVLLPVGLLAAINVIVFLIPCQSGERISFAITVLLSYGVFLTFVTAVMPSASEGMSVLVTYLYLLFMVSALMAVLSVLTVRIHHRDHHQHTVSASVVKCVVWLEKLMCPRKQGNRVCGTSFIGKDARGNIFNKTDGATKTASNTSDLHLKGSRGNTTKTNQGNLLKTNEGQADESDPDPFSLTAPSARKSGGRWETEWAQKGGSTEAKWAQDDLSGVVPAMTWKRVVDVVDKFLFRFFAVLLSLSTVVVILLVAVVR